MYIKYNSQTNNQLFNTNQNNNKKLSTIDDVPFSSLQETELDSIYTKMNSHQKSWRECFAEFIKKNAMVENSFSIVKGELRVKSILFKVFLKSEVFSKIFFSFYQELLPHSSSFNEFRMKFIDPRESIEMTPRAYSPEDSPSFSKLSPQPLLTSHRKSLSQKMAELRSNCKTQQSQNSELKRMTSSYNCIEEKLPILHSNNLEKIKKSCQNSTYSQFETYITKENILTNVIAIDKDKNLLKRVNEGSIKDNFEEESHKTILCIDISEDLSVKREIKTKSKEKRNLSKNLANNILINPLLTTIQKNNNIIFEKEKLDFLHYVTDDNRALNNSYKPSLSYELLRNFLSFSYAKKSKSCPIFSHSKIEKLFFDKFPVSASLNKKLVKNDNKLSTEKVPYEDLNIKPEETAFFRNFGEKVIKNNFINKKNFIIIKLNLRGEKTYGKNYAACALKVFCGKELESAYEDLHYLKEDFNNDICFILYL